MKIICTNPLVAIVDDFADDAFCEHVKTIASPLLKTGQVADPKGGRKESKLRTNREALLDTWSDPILTQFVQRISELVRLPPEYSEPINVLHYQQDQEFHPHTDAILPDKGGRERLAMGGQRIFTTLCYLNDVEIGGETVFPALKVAVKPKKGRVLLFGNTLPGSAERHPAADHAGLPTNDHEKWAVNVSWRQSTFVRHRSYPDKTGELTAY
ncbi:MAG: 2OG-Fe(II) oxygenase [Pseudomonadota bacterium]